MDTQIEHKKRFTPKQIYGGVGVVLLTKLTRSKLDFD